MAYRQTDTQQRCSYEMSAFGGQDNLSMHISAHGAIAGLIILIVIQVCVLAWCCSMCTYWSLIAYVDCLVTDGINIGRPCCSVLHCTGDLRTPRDHWCAAHQAQAAKCVIVGCAELRREDHRTCGHHAAVETHYYATGNAMFTLRGRLQRAQVAHPTDAVTPTAPVDEDIEVEIIESTAATSPCPEKTEDSGVRTVQGKFGRCFTHCEQLMVRPCGIIRGRETFYGSESIPQVVVS